MQNKIKAITITAMFAAVIFVVTWLFHIPIGLHGGYVHIGDSFVYLAAAMLPMPYAIAAAAIGAGIADLATPGAQIWIIPSVVIKGLLVLLFTSKLPRILAKRNITAAFLGIIVTTVGYGIATWVMTMSLQVAASESVFSIVQAALSAVAFIVVGMAFDKAQLKTTLFSDFDQG